MKTICICQIQKQSFPCEGYFTEAAQCVLHKLMGQVLLQSVMLQSFTLSVQDIMCASLR